MKITLIVFLIFFLSVSISAEESTLQEKIEVTKKDWENFKFEFYISPGVMPDVGIGFPQRNKLQKSFQEGTLILHADLIPSVWELRHNAEDFYKIYLWGIKYRSTYFYKLDYSGFNWFFNLGFSSIYIDLGLDPGGSSPSNPSWLVFPDLAVGCGYSWKLNNDHYFRISADVGLKILISNIYISYVW
ncbi:MAG: hypothetical protein P9M11_04120 [Candidatus Tenebribacter burtonii]|jgi:hypothetical protein|nr:hypothetical protein [Candidatus Tenebribacter burtonii]